MDKVNWTKLEEKWRQRWIKEKDFEAEPDSREKKFITVAYPYPNSPQHVGHGRTYTTADVHARFLRMMGYNVLFPPDKVHTYVFVLYALDSTLDLKKGADAAALREAMDGHVLEEAKLVGTYVPDS